MDQPTLHRLRRTGLSILVAGSILIGSGAVWAQSDDSTPSSDQTTDAPSTPTPSDSSGSSGGDSRSSGPGSSSGNSRGSSRPGSGSLGSVWLESGTVSPADAIATAQSEVSGTFTGFGMGESDDDTPVYFVQIDDQIIAIDGSSGAVIETSSASGNDEATSVNESETSATPAAVTDTSTAVAGDDSATDQTSPLASMLTAAQISPAEAASIAQTETGAAATSIRLRVNDDNVLIYSVHTETQSVRIDAATGEVLEVMDRDTSSAPTDTATPATDDTVATPAA